MSSKDEGFVCGALGSIGGHAWLVWDGDAWSARLFFQELCTNVHIGIILSGGELFAERMRLDHIMQIL
jgi:hypothetical protein